MSFILASEEPEEVERVKFYWGLVKKLGLTSPMGIIAVVLIILFVIYIIKPEALGRIRLLLFSAFTAIKWVRREKVKRKYELDIIEETKSINKTLGIDILSYEPSIKWAKETTKEAFIKENKVIIKMSYHEDKNRTYALASLGFIRKSLLDISKQYVSEEVMECSSLLVTRKLLEKTNSEALNHLHIEILQPLFRANREIEDKFNDLVDMDNQALFFEIFLPEILEFGKSLYPRPFNMSILSKEVEDLINFLHTIATRNFDEEVPLELRTTFFSIAIVMLGKRETIESKGIGPYKKSVEIVIEDGYRNIYVLSRKTKNHAEKVGQAFKNHKYVKNVTIRKGKVYRVNGTTPIDSVCIVIQNSKNESEQTRMQENIS